MSNLMKRTLTGILFVAVVMGCIVAHPLAFGVLFAAVAALSVREFVRLVNNARGTHASATLGMVCAVYLHVSMALYVRTGVALLFFPYVVLLLYVLVRELYRGHPTPLENWAFTFAAQLYVALPLALLHVLAHRQGTYQPVVPMALFIFLWLNDTGAYCIGSLMGRHKLFPRISPKKTWEGSLGGAAVVLLGAVVLWAALGTLSLPTWLGFGAVVVLFGTWGDLTESRVKRQLGIKDSGNILPGHGGWLDRFDSALLATPAVVVYFCLMQLFA